MTIARGEAKAPADLASRAPVTLAGQWRIRREAPGPARDGLLAVPGPWQGATLEDGRTMPALARARCSLVLHDVPSGEYRLYLQPVFGASRVAIDGVVRSTHGAIGNDAATTRYMVVAHDIAFTAPGGDLAIAVDVATFRDIGSGLRQPPVLGGAVPMQRWVVREWAKLLLVGATFMMIGLFALIVYANRPRDRSALYLGLGALAILGAILGTGFENVVLFMAPGLSHEAYYFILLACADGGMVLWVAYARALFPGADRSRAASWPRRWWHATGGGWACSKCSTAATVPISPRTTRSGCPLSPRRPRSRSTTPTCSPRWSRRATATKASSPRCRAGW